MEFKSLVAIEGRLMLVYLQGLFDLTCPEAWLPSEDAYVL